MSAPSPLDNVLKPGLDLIESDLVERYIAALTGHSAVAGMLALLRGAVCNIYSIGVVDPGKMRVLFSCLKRVIGSTLPDRVVAAFPVLLTSDTQLGSGCQLKAGAYLLISSEYSWGGGRISAVAMSDDRRCFDLQNIVQTHHVFSQPSDPGLANFVCWLSAPVATPRPGEGFNAQSMYEHLVSLLELPPLLPQSFPSLRYVQ